MFRVFAMFVSYISSWLQSSAVWLCQGFTQTKYMILYVLTLQILQKGLSWTQNFKLGTSQTYDLTQTLRVNCDLQNNGIAPPLNQTWCQFPKVQSGWLFCCILSPDYFSYTAVTHSPSMLTHNFLLSLSVELVSSAGLIFPTAQQQTVIVSLSSCCFSVSAFIHTSPPDQHSTVVTEWSAFLPLVTTTITNQKNWLDSMGGIYYIHQDGNDFDSACLFA